MRDGGSTDHRLWVETNYIKKKRLVCHNETSTLYYDHDEIKSSREVTQMIFLRPGCGCVFHEIGSMGKFVDVRVHWEKARWFLLTSRLGFENHCLEWREWSGFCATTMAEMVLSWQISQLIVAIRLVRTSVLWRSNSKVVGGIKKFRLKISNMRLVLLTAKSIQVFHETSTVTFTTC